MKTIMQKLSVVLFMCWGMCFCLTGCMPEFDASTYIKACLDANTKGEFEEYAEITGSTVEQAEAIYNQMLDAEMAYINSYNVSDEKKEAFRQLFIEMYKNFKYEVGESARNDDNSYTVPVTTYKLMIFKDIMTEGEAYLTQYAQAEIDAGRTPTTEQLEEEALNYMYDVMKSNLETLEYGEPVTTEVIVAPTKNGSTVLYSVDDSDLQKLVEMLLDVENAE